MSDNDIDPAAVASPKVFLGYDQEALDRAYDQRAWAPNAKDIIDWYAVASATARNRLVCERDIAYGKGEDERFDFFPTSRPDAPVVVYVHGGAWRLLSKEESAFAAEAFVASGASFVALDFSITPKVRLPEMAAQVRRALVWLWRNGDSHGINRNRLYLCGHSSGAHLTATTLVTDWTPFEDLPRDFIKGAVCASGSYDLQAVMLSARGHYLNLDAAEEEALSPQRHVEMLECPIIVAYGENESPEFQRQARDFHAAIGRAGHAAELIVGENLNHFEIVTTLARRDGLLARAMLGLMGLTG